jgi:MFS family permease
MNQVRRWRAFAVLAVSFFMTVADLAIVNVALPTIGRKLHMAESSLQWVVTGYALTFGGFLLLGGRAADLLGRRRILMAGMASGLLNTGQQLGGAIGVAIASTIAATHASTLLHQGTLPAAALTSGFQWHSGPAAPSPWPRSRSPSCWSAATS